MSFSAGLRSFYKPCSKKSGLNILVPILTQRCKYTSGCDTVSYSNLAAMILAQLLFQIIQNTHTGTLLVGTSPIRIELMFSEYILV